MTTPTETQTSTDAVEAKKVPIPRWLVTAFWRGHRLVYSATGGRLGLRTPKSDRYGMLRLRTTGRRTGQERDAILAYFEDGPDVVLVPMNGWADPEPAWWLNLQATPDAIVDLPDGGREVTAHKADPEDRARLWTMARDTWGKDMDAYAAERGRETQMVILQPRTTGRPTSR